VANDEYDMAAGGIGISRVRGGLWSESYAQVRRSALIVGQNAPYIKTYRDIRTIGVVVRSAAHEHALKNASPKTKIVGIEGVDQGVELLMNSDIEALGTGTISAHYQKKKWSMLEVIDLHNQGDFAEDIAFSVRDNPLLLHKINQFVLSLKGYQI
jgi:ABC-type amino acid transport substrate-binding protein